MVFQLNLSSEIPIYLQLRNQIVKGIASGDLKRGESLPTVRQMASDAGINAMTVNKAYQILKCEGYIEIDRRRGAAVKADLDMDREFRDRLSSELELTCAQAQAKGLPREEFLELCSRIFDQFSRTSKDEAPTKEE